MARGTTGDIAAVIREITGHTSVTVTDTLVLEAINTVIEEAQIAADWQPQDQSWECTYPRTADGIALPDGIVFVYNVFQRNLSQTDPAVALAPLGELTRQQWIDRINAGDMSRAFPRPSISGSYYYLWDGKLFVVPQQSAALTIVVDYRGFVRPLTAIGTTLTTESSNYFTLTYQRMVTWGALAIVWHALGEDDFAMAAEQRGQRFLTRAIKNDAVLKSSGPPKVRGT